MRVPLRITLAMMSILFPHRAAENAEYMFLEGKREYSETT